MSGTLHIISNLLSDHTVLLMCLNNGQKIFNYVSLKLLIEIRSSMKDVDQNALPTTKNLFATILCKRRRLLLQNIGKYLNGRQTVPTCQTSLSII